MWFQGAVDTCAADDPFANSTSTHPDLQLSEFQTIAILFDIQILIFVSYSSFEKPSEGGELLFVLVI